MTLFNKCFKHKALQKFSHEELHWVESMKFLPSKSFPFYDTTLSGFVQTMVSMEGTN